VCPNTNEVIIFAKKGNDWEKEVTFTEHDSLVTGIDWAPNTNKIVTCSQDRNAYVWSYEAAKPGQPQGVWKPSLVILRLNRGCTSVKWSPKEDKFAVGSGAAAVSVCYYVEDNQWWLSKLIKGDKSGINSTISCVAWHPNNIFLAAGGTDSKTRVFSGFVQNLDDKKALVEGTCFGTRLPFGQLLAEYPTSGWVQSMDWSPSGFSLAWTTRDSCVHFLSCTAVTKEQTQTVAHPVQTLKCRGLPYTACLWVGSSTLIVGGHDCVPVLFQGSLGNMNYIRDLDGGEASGQKKSVGIAAQFQNQANLGVDSVDVELPSRHQNRIMEIIHCGPTSFSTVGWDGQLIVWPFQACGFTAQ